MAWWIFARIALATEAQGGWVVAVGGLVATGEGTDVPVRPGIHALFRVRGHLDQGLGRFGFDLDERSTWPLASRKTLLGGIHVGPAAVLTGVGLVERGLFGPHARADVHLPLDLSVIGPWGFEARIRGRLTVATVGAVGRSHAPAEAALAWRHRSVLLEVGWRDEFGHDVFLFVIGGIGP